MSNLARETLGALRVNEEYPDGKHLERDGVIYTDNPRAAVVAKYRELADRLEAKELCGARVEWADREDMPAIVVVEVVDPEKGPVRLNRYTFKPAAEHPLKAV